MNDEEKTAYEEGRMAATNAEARSKCPYDESSANHAAWQDGYDYVVRQGKAGEPND